MSTLLDVAKHAGVSTATVSRYLNSKARLAPATRAAVQQAVDHLGYQPNRVAQRLRVAPGEARLIGLIVPDLQNPFFADVVRGVEAAARTHGCAVLFGHSGESAEREADLLDLLRAESVDGVVLPTVEPGRDLGRLRVPVVFVDRRPAHCALDVVVSDNEAGARAAVKHLIALGHRRIGFVGGRPDLSTSHERLAGYRAGLCAGFVPYDPALVREGDSQQEGGRDEAAALLDLPDPPSALFAGNNLMTLGALVAIRERGLRIPHDVAVVGYDDMPWSAAFDPPLTTVRQMGVEMGEQATDLLVRRIERPDAPARLVVLQPTLVVRASCGAVGAACVR